MFALHALIDSGIELETDLINSSGKVNDESAKLPCPDSIEETLGQAKVHEGSGSRIQPIVDQTKVGGYLSSRFN